MSFESDAEAGIIRRVLSSSINRTFFVAQLEIVLTSKPPVFPTEGHISRFCVLIPCVLIHLFLWDQLSTPHDQLLKRSCSWTLPSLVEHRNGWRVETNHSAVIVSAFHTIRKVGSKHLRTVKWHILNNRSCMYPFVQRPPQCAQKQFVWVLKLPWPACHPLTGRLQLYGLRNWSVIHTQIHARTHSLSWELV